MSPDLQNLAWHRSIGKLIEQLDSPEFWSSIVRLLNEHVPIDNWVALIFSSQQVQVICFPDSADDIEKEALTHDYVKGLYVLDPFYIANRENPQSGIFHLLDIAPAYFKKTEYYNLYFARYVSVDEVQYNVKLDQDRTLCLSLGSQSRFSQEQIAVLDLIQPWITALMHKRMSFEVDIEKSTTQPHKWQDTMEQLDALLTVREMEILRLLFSGFSNRQVAGKLSIAVETVKAHRRNFYAKLNIKSQSEFFALFFHEK